MLRPALIALMLLTTIGGCAPRMDPLIDNLPAGERDTGAAVVTTLNAIDMALKVCARDPGLGAAGATARLGQLGFTYHFDGPLDGAYSNSGSNDTLPSLVFRLVPPKLDRRGNIAAFAECKMGWTTLESEDEVELRLKTIGFRYSTEQIGQMLRGSRPNAVFHWETERANGANMFFMTIIPNWRQ